MIGGILLSPGYQLEPGEKNSNLDCSARYKILEQHQAFAYCVARYWAVAQSKLACGASQILQIIKQVFHGETEVF